jgi:hypothetical protein
MHILAYHVAHQEEKQMDATRENLITANQAATILGVEHWTVRKWWNHGINGRILESVRIGGKFVRTSKEAINRFLGLSSEPITQQESEAELRRRAKAATASVQSRGKPKPKRGRPVKSK